MGSSSFQFRRRRLNWWWAKAGWRRGPPRGWSRKGSRETGKTRGPGVGCGFGPRAASHLCIYLSECMPQDNERKALARGLASRNRWKRRVPPRALLLETRPAVGASAECRPRGCALSTLLSLNLTRNPRCGARYAQRPSQATAAPLRGSRDRPTASRLGLLPEERVSGLRAAPRVSRGRRAHP